MQLPSELTLTIGVFASAISMIAALYLIHIWRTNPRRLPTDLSLMFGVSLVFQSTNTLLQTLITSGILPNTLESLRIRSVVIGLVVLPIIPGLLNIWAFRFKKYHNRVVLGVLSYWFTVLLLAPTVEILMGLLIPIMIAIMLGFIGTFAITWRTGRLEEVRSDFMLVSLLIILTSQILRVPLLKLGISILSDILNAAGTIIAALAFVVPLLQSRAPDGEAPVSLTSSAIS